MIQVITIFGASWVLGWILSPKKTKSGIEIKVDADSQARYPIEYVSIINNTAQQLGLDPDLIAAIIYVETGGRNVTGDQGRSFGLMQVQYGTARDMGFKGQPDDLMNPVSSIFFGSKYLKNRIDKYGLEFGVLGYNTGTPIRNGIIFDPNDYRRKVFSALKRFKQQRIS